MIDRESIVDNTATADTSVQDCFDAVNETVESVIKALRKKAGEYEANKFMTVASAFKQFSNELEQS